MTILSGKPLLQIAPPTLPNPDGQYTALWQEQYNNILRLYFQRLSAFQSAVISPQSGGASFFMPHATFFSDVDQTLASADTATLVSFGAVNSFSEVLGVNINGVADTDIEVDFTGMYKVEVNLQVRSTTAASKDITVWLRKNSVDLPNSARRVTFNKTGGEEFTYSVNIDLQSSDTLQVVWAATSTDVILNYVAASAPYPAIPSAIISINHASNVLLE